MAKGKVSGVSVPTGYYFPCPMNQVRRPVKHRTPIALPIMRGPKKHFAKCQCGISMFFPSDWTSEMGLSEQEAARAGLAVLTSF